MHLTCFLNKIDSDYSPGQLKNFIKKASMVRELKYVIMAVFLPIISGAGLKVNAQQFNPEFEHLNIEHGLPHSTVTSIVNDSYGYIWIGTEGGLAPV